MTDSKRIEQQAADWLVRRDAGDWAPHDQQALEAWLEASARNKVAFLRLEAAWAEAGRLQALAAGLPAGGPPPRTVAADPGAPTPGLADLRGITFAPRPAHARPGRSRHGVAAGALADADADGVAARELQHLVAGQAVVQDHVGLAEHAQRAQGQQAGVAGAGVGVAGAGVAGVVVAGAAVSVGAGVVPVGAAGVVAGGWLGTRALLNRPPLASLRALG